jgi:predicted amidohydrolase
VAAPSVEGIVVAVAQVGARVGDITANLELAARYAGRAAGRAADLVVFPECFLQGYSLSRSVLELAEPISGPAVRALSRIAAERRVAIVAGMIEANPAQPHRPHNTAVVIGRDGELIGSYRKVHLFAREAEAFSAGDGYPVFDVPLLSGRAALRVGVCICFDVEFPEVPRLLAIGGAQLIAVPSADMEPYRVQQAANLMSRAIENNVHVALANTVDRRSAATFFGGSGIAAPDGTLVSAGYLRPRLVTATLTDAAVEASGGAGSSLRDRRVETFGGLLGPSGGRRQGDDRLV